MRSRSALRGILPTLILGLVAAGAPLKAESEGPGRQVLTDQKCNLCHSISAAGIEAKTTSEKLKGPDLTGVGEKHQAAWLAQYLKKEVEQNGKAHMKPFKGSDEELQSLIDWLLEQEAPDGSK